jgi:hypothetical protein
MVRFGNLALAAATATQPSPKEIWSKVFLATVSIGEYKLAYETLIRTPFADL